MLKPLLLFFMTLIFLLELFSTFFLTGLIWTVQIVHYPSFKYIAEKVFFDFTGFHAKRISFIVVPMMLLELATSSYLMIEEINLFSSTKFVLVLLIWLSTFLLSVPIHGKLNKNRDEALIRKLIVTNWFRTILWSAKSIILFIQLTV